MDAESLRERCAADWGRAVGHRFVDELGDETLDDGVFRRYLVQDYAFVDDLTRLIGHAAGDAPTVEARVRLADFLKTVGTDEDDYFRRSFDALDVPDMARVDPELAPPTRQFRDLLRRAAREGGYAESLTVLLAVEWVYADWAEGVTTPDGPFYLREWVELHDVRPFHEFVNWLRNSFDEAVADASPRRRERVTELFKRAVELEGEFFDAAYTDT